MDRAAKTYLARGKNAMDGGKLKEAQNQFEAVLRLYHTNQTSEHYKAAQIHLEELKKKMEGGSG
jgi:outer membrane protein assembly factor BamD (BamD/ComL family)